MFRYSTSTAENVNWKKGEIYPFRQNIAGYCDFVYLENDTVTLNTTGIITDENGRRYSVHMDNQYINLMALQKGE